AETAGGVVEADGGRTGIEGAGIGPDDTLTQQGDPQAFVREVVLDELGHRPVVKDMPGFAVGAEALVYLGLGRSIPDPRIALCRGSERVAEAADDVGHGTPPFEITGGEGTDLGIALFVVVPKLDTGAVEEWDEEAVDGRCPLETAGGEAEFLNHQWMEKAG